MSNGKGGARARGRQEGGRGVKEDSHPLRNDEYTHYDAESRPQATCMRSGGAARWQTAENARFHESVDLTFVDGQRPRSGRRGCSFHSWLRSGDSNAALRAISAIDRCGDAGRSEIPRVNGPFKPPPRAWISEEPHLRERRGLRSRSQLMRRRVTELGIWWEQPPPK